MLTLAAVRRRRLMRLAAAPPVAVRRPHIVRFGRVDGENRGSHPDKLISPPLEKVDDLFWLRDDTRSNPEVHALLNAENAYTQHATRHLEGARERLYKELVSRVQETDSSAPYAHGEWLYYTRTEKGLSYTIHCRRRRDATGAETVVIDENELAKGHKMLDVAAVESSPDHSVVAYSVDRSGYETYEVRFKGLDGAASPADVLEGTTGEVIWGHDNGVVFYLTFDDAHRPHKVWRHVLGTPQADDTCLFTDDDAIYNVGASKTRSGEFLVVQSESETTSEVHLLPLTPRTTALLARDPAYVSGALHMVQPRTDGVLYDVDHYGASVDGEWADVLVIRTNADGAKNFKVCLAPLPHAAASEWKELLPHSPARYVTGLDVFAGFWAIEGREGGYANMWLLQMGADMLKRIQGVASRSTEAATAPVRLVQVPPREDVYVVSPSGANMEWNAATLRFKYASPVTPDLTTDIDVAAAIRAADAADAVTSEAGDGVTLTRLPPSAWSSGVLTVAKAKAAPNCDPSLYRVQRLWATARDGARVPISVLYRPDAIAKSTAASDFAVPPQPCKLLLYGYGSYGICVDMGFSSGVLGLCDRGMVYAVAHIRGGSEMGRHWYEDQGKLLTKRNTFNDFIDCADHLISAGWTRKGDIACMGASAGGLLMGAVMNERPDLWGAVVSQVGFVDVMTTMCDATIPLTVGEWLEWGNPNEQEAHDYIASYSPMDNVRRQAYPRALLIGGLHDSRVAYWEIEKFAQRVRAANTGPNVPLVKMDMGAGHFSYSDRYQYLCEKAFEYAWLMSALGVPI